MANKRIIDLTDVQNIAEDDYVILDSNTNGTRKILASNIGGGISYSTTEQNTGLKWIDGKDIYQRTFNVSANVSIDITSINIDSVVDISGTFETSSHGIYSVNMYALSTYYSRVSLNRTSLTLEVHGDNDWAASTGHVTIQYTKTTDTV